MEKYSQWRDAATGVAPFLPVKPKLGPVAPLIALLRLVILVIPGLILTMALYITFPVAGFQKKMFRVQLWLLGISGVAIEYSDGDGRFKATSNSSSPGAGDIIVSPFVSPIDPLLYASILDCVFVIPYGTEKYAEVSLTEAISAALSGPADLNRKLTSSRKPKHFQKIAEDAKKHGQTVVLFAEGSTTNSKGVLSLFSVPLRDLNVYPVVLKYTSAELTSPIPQSFLSWAWTALSRTSFIKVRIRIGLQSKSSDLNMLQAEIAAVGKITALGLSAGDKNEFLTHWLQKK